MEQHGARMLISSKLIQQAPSHVPNPIPKRIRAQDQFKIRLFEPLRIVKRSPSSFRFLRSDQSCRFCYTLPGPGPKGTPGVSIHSCPARAGLCASVKVLVLCVRRKWEQETQFTEGVTTIPKAKWKRNSNIFQQKHALPPLYFLSRIWALRNNCS